MLGIYVRLSKEDENSNSIENQLREGKEFAKTNGYQNYHEYNEGQGVSGGNEVKDRPELNRLMKDIASQKIHAVWFRHQNRLERNSVTFHIFSALAKKMQIKVHFGDHEADLNDPTQFLQASIMTAINAYQLEMQRGQIKRTLLDNAREGKATGGNHIPYGYTTDKENYLTIDPETSKTVELIFNRCLEGIGGGVIAKELNEMGIPTKHGATKWKQPTIHGIIKNPAYKGQKRFRDKLYPIPIIIKKEVWNKAQKQLKHNAAFKGKRVEHKYLLKHLTYCGNCGKPMHVMNYNRTIRYYRCSSARSSDVCHNPYFRIDALENLIWGLFEFDTLYEGLESHMEDGRNEEHLQELVQQKTKSEQKLSQLNRKLEKIIELVIAGKVSDDEIDRTRRAVKTERDTVEKEIENFEEQISSIREQDKLKLEVKMDLGVQKSGMANILKSLFTSFGKDMTQLKEGAIETFVDMFFETSEKSDNLDRMTFNEKRELIKKYIKRIDVIGSKQGHSVLINYNIPFHSQIEISKDYEVARESKTGRVINFDLLNNKEVNKDNKRKFLTKMILSQIDA